MIEPEKKILEEMKRLNISRKDLCNTLSLNYGTLCKQLLGYAPLPAFQRYRIQEYLAKVSSKTDSRQAD
jgi:hypothetical protein